MTTTPDANDDSILAELNGQSADDGMPPYAPGETAPAKAPNRERELTVAGAPPMSRVAKADSQHSTAAGGAGYRVRVHGDYYAMNPDGKGKVKKSFADLEFNVPNLNGCLSVIKNKLIKPTLRKMDPAFASDRTCFISSVTPLGAAPKSRNIAYMDRGQLEAHVQESEPSIPIDLSVYPQDDAGTAALRESIIDYVQNPDPVRPDEKGRNTVKPGDPGTFLYRERERRRVLAEDQELAALNPDIANAIGAP